MTGKIRTLRVDKGFGFIKDDAGKEYFFHQSAVNGERIDDLREGDSVEFEVVDKYRGAIKGGGSNAPRRAREDPPFKMVVKFEGPNVLEGIKQLLRFGFAEPPLPPHLATIHSSAQNSFSLSPAADAEEEDGDEDADANTNGD
jgi:cold shock CspA family protein